MGQGTICDTGALASEAKGAVKCKEVIPIEDAV